MTIEKPSDNETNKNEAGFEDLQKATEGLKKKKFLNRKLMKSTNKFQK